LFSSSSHNTNNKYNNKKKKPNTFLGEALKFFWGSFVGIFFQHYAGSKKKKKIKEKN
jgi:hypothetical protein